MINGKIATEEKGRDNIIPDNTLQQTTNKG